LKAAAIYPLAANLATQQRRFDAFRQEFNWERSHEALNRTLPGKVYRASASPIPSKLPLWNTAAIVTVRHVRPNGEIRWRGEMLYVSHVLAKDYVALKQIDEKSWEIRYSFHLLGFSMNKPEPSVLLIAGARIPDNV